MWFKAASFSAEDEWDCKTVMMLQSRIGGKSKDFCRRGTYRCKLLMFFKEIEELMGACGSSFNEQSSNLGRNLLE